MVAAHVVADRVDHLVIGVAPGHEPAFASDQPGHRRPPTRVVRPPYCQDVGVTLASAAALRIQICGPLVIERDGERLEARLPGRQGRLAFVYLVAHRHRHVNRDELAEALWPDGPLSAIEAGLNPLLSKLRRALGADAVEGRSTLRLHLPDGWVDLEAAAEAIHRAESAVAQARLGAGLGPVAGRPLHRRAGRSRPARTPRGSTTSAASSPTSTLRALECYAAAELGVGGTELAGAVRAGRQLVRLAPLRESGYRHLMEALAAQGNVAEALHVYSELCDTLRDQLGVTPSPATRALYDRLIREPN